MLGQAVSRLTGLRNANAYLTKQVKLASGHLSFKARSCLFAPHKRMIMTSHASTPSASDKQTARVTHNQLQTDEFSKEDIVSKFTEPLPSEITQRLQTITDAIPGLSSESRVIDVGSGTGCLIPYLQKRGVQDILAVDLAEPMLAEIRKVYAHGVGNVGNDLGVRTWCGDVVELPNYLGWASDAFIFNGVFGNLYSPKSALQKAALQLKPGGHIVVSHPLGRAWQAALAQKQPELTPHAIPDRQGLEQLIEGLPLKIVDFRDEQDLYLAVLQVPPMYRFPGAPVRMAAKVVTGFGRGSRQLGTPTANMDPAGLQEQLKGLQRGVYYGYARLAPRAEEGFTTDDGKVYKMVMNIGRRPTVNTGDEDPTVEVHVMNAYTQDFYGQEIRVVVLGFVRPEVKFPSLSDLVNRIKLDIAIGRNQLDLPENQQYAQDSFLL